jgi:hypothetical protein
MKHIAILVGLALAVGIGGAAMACENGIYATDETVVLAPQQMAGCATGGCTTNGPAVTTRPQRGKDTGGMLPEPVRAANAVACSISQGCATNEPTAPMLPQSCSVSGGCAVPPATQRLACGSGRSCGCCW